MSDKLTKLINIKIVYNVYDMIEVGSVPGNTVDIIPVATISL